jgi:hypothetical protein
MSEGLYLMGYYGKPSKHLLYTLKKWKIPPIPLWFFISYWLSEK